MSFYHSGTVYDNQIPTSSHCPRTGPAHARCQRLRARVGAQADGVAPRRSCRVPEQPQLHPRRVMTGELELPRKLSRRAVQHAQQELREVRNGGA
jgi:hypothetical protein